MSEQGKRKEGDVCAYENCKRKGHWIRCGSSMFSYEVFICARHSELMT